MHCYFFAKMRKNFEVWWYLLLHFFSLLFMHELIFSQQMLPADYIMEAYLPLLEHKKVAVVTNHSALIGSTHLVDTLMSKNIDVRVIFTPEHGFLGAVPDGEAIDNTQYKGIPVVSLYGQKLKPTPDDLKDLDIVVYDIQDVGVRFYTYISTLTYVMEACAEVNVPLLVLDRPNPNGNYVDGPLLNMKFRSFVGALPIPIVYGLTVGELALMIKGERWISKADSLVLTVISCVGYTHNDRYELPVKPSPNLTSKKAVLLYPTVGLLEGTVISVGRGTYRPFELVGHPDLRGDTTFVPHAIPGMSTHPPYDGQVCHGYSLDSLAQFLERKPHIHLEFIIELYKQWKALGKKEPFFKTTFFDKLAGTDQLRKQIIQGKTAEEIRQSWTKDLKKFKEIRKKYLLYPDSEIN